MQTLGVMGDSGGAIIQELINLGGFPGMIVQERLS